MPTQWELSPEQITQYRDHAQRRRQQEKPLIEKRHKQAWKAARKAASLLKEDFGATRVVIFGSLARDTGFSAWSDVDIAPWGIALEDTLRAIGAVMDLNTEVLVNLVDVNTAQSSLLQIIEFEGIELWLMSICL